MVVFAATAAGHFSVELIRIQNLHISRVKMNPCQTIKALMKFFVELMLTQGETVNIVDINSA